MGRRKIYGKKSVMLPIMVTVSMHARLKARARAEGRSMAAIVRELLDGYLETAVPEPEPTVYDELAETFSRILE